MISRFERGEAAGLCGRNVTAYQVNVKGGMTELTRSTVIEYVPPSSLKPHPRQFAIYGEEALDQALVASVKNLGIQAVLYAKVDGTIISGLRRKVAAEAAGLRTIPVIRVENASYGDEREALVKHNRTRVKTLGQALNEGRELEDIERERAEKREKAGKSPLGGGGRGKRNLTPP